MKWGSKWCNSEVGGGPTTNRETKRRKTDGALPLAAKKTIPKIKISRGKKGLSIGMSMYSKDAADMFDFR